MTENGLFVLGEPQTQLHDILWAVHDGKTQSYDDIQINVYEYRHHVRVK